MEETVEANRESLSHLHSSLVPSVFQLLEGGVRMHPGSKQPRHRSIRISIPTLGLLRSRVVLELGLPFLITAGH